MNLRSNVRNFVLSLCVLALLAAQALGVQRAYVCLCSGEAVVTQASHCHGPHGAQCHAPGSDSSASHSEEGQGNRENHTALKGELPLRSAPGVPQVSAPMVLLATLPLLEVLLAPPAAQAPAPARVAGKSLLPFGVTVARTVVLLI